MLITGYGGPDSLEAVGPFMRNLTGREPSPEMLERVKGRYAAIGGASPLTGIARKIASRLSAEFETLGSPMPVAVGMAYWEPFIADALGELKAAGCDRVVAVSLSAFESEIAQGTFRRRVDEAAEAIGGVEVVELPLAARFDRYAAFFAEAIREVLGDSGMVPGTVLAFSAHSLPIADLVVNDPYVGGLEATAREIAARLGLPDGERTATGLTGGEPALGALGEHGGWLLAYQSKGNIPGAWLGPELDDLIGRFASAGLERLVVCPIGFMTDHMETCYDLDVVARRIAAGAGIALDRVAVPNDDGELLAAMAKQAVELA